MENLIGNIIGSFIKQGVIGWIIIFIILILAILSYKFSNISKNSYENLLDSFNNALEIEKSIGEHKNLTLKVFKQDILKNIDEEFKKSEKKQKVTCFHCFLAYISSSNHCVLFSEWKPGKAGKIKSEIYCGIDNQQGGVTVE